MGRAFLLTTIPVPRNQRLESKVRIGTGGGGDRVKFCGERSCKGIFFNMYEVGGGTGRKRCSSIFIVYNSVAVQHIGMKALRFERLTALAIRPSVKRQKKFEDPRLQIPRRKCRVPYLTDLKRDTGPQSRKIATPRTPPSIPLRSSGALREPTKSTLLSSFAWCLTNLMSRMNGKKHTHGVIPSLLGRPA